MQGSKGQRPRTTGNHVGHHEERPSEDGLDSFRKPASTTTPEGVAICTVGELFGGVERHILGVLTGLTARGMSTLLVLFHDGELAAQARGQGVDPLILSNRNRSLWATSRQLAGILKQHRIHLVHVHGYKATVFCTLARRWHSFAMVKTEHGLPEPMAGSPLRALRNRLYFWADSVAARIAHATVCYVTEDLRRWYQQAHAGLRVTVIPNGVDDMDRHQFRRQPEMREDWFNLILVGRLDTVKGHHLAIQAVAATDVPPHVHLHILGVGPCESELHALAESLGIKPRVHLLGFRRNVYDYIAHCNVLLMPSLHEGLPYTLLEAMALGTAVIASRVGGLAEVIQDGNTGLLVPPRSAKALAQAIRQLHDDPVLCSRLGEQARRDQQARYSLEAMIESYLGIYQALLAHED